MHCNLEAHKISAIDLFCFQVLEWEYRLWRLLSSLVSISKKKEPLLPILPAWVCIAFELEWKIRI